MDYDLFQSDEDEELLSAYVAASQQPAGTQLQLPAADNVNYDQEEDDDESALDLLAEFNCAGRDSVKGPAQFPSSSFVPNGYTLNGSPPRSRMDNLRFDFAANQLQIGLVLRYLHGEACKNVQKLSAAVAGQQQLQQPPAQLATKSSSWFAMRQQVTHFYHLLLLLEPEQSAASLRQLRELLNSCLDAAAWRTLYFAEHSKGNDCTTPAYHLYHGALEWRLLDLLCQQAADNQADYEAQLTRLLDDLVLCSQLLYRSKHSVQLLQTSAFMCRCSKELWLLLQQLHDFWPRFQQALQRHKTQQQLDALGYLEFCAWLRLNLARLAAFQVDAEALQIGSQLQQFLASSPSEQQRRVYLCLLAPLPLDAAALCQLWESLHRSLNCQFNQSAGVEQLPLTLSSGAAYLQRYRQLLASAELEDLQLNSFTLFALLLGRTLQLASSKSQAQKLTGRIFSKFSAAKLLALNECGIHHVIELFLCLLLSHQGEFQDLAGKLREMLLCLALDKLPPARRQLAAKGHMALLLLHAERRQPLADYIGKLLTQLAAIRNELEVCAIYATTLPSIFELSTDFGNGEQLLLAPWLTHYLEHSAQAPQERVWQALHSLCQRLRQPVATTGGQAMWQALQQHVLPQLRLQYVSGFSSWLPKLAAQFVLLDTDQKLLPALLLDAEPANLAANAQLLLLLLELDQQPPGELIIQVWLKSLVLLQPQHAAVKALTPHVLQLAELQALDLDAATLQAREPLCAFFGALGRCGMQQTTAAGRMQLSHKLHSYAAHFERWLPSGNPELTSRFYNFMAIVIYNCATLAYVRSKPSCFFHTAMTRFLLTTQLQAGVAPEARLPPLLHKMLPVLLQGIGRLPYRQDAYLTRTLEQLVLHWTPHFACTKQLLARPFATLLQADAAGELSHFVLQQLAAQFLSVQRSQAAPHAGLVLTLLQQLIVGLSEAGAERQLLIILRAFHVPLLEHLMFVGELAASRLQLLQLYRLLLQQTHFQRSSAAQDLCCSDFRALAEKHLAHCTYFYFQMLIKLAELAPQLIVPLFDFVRQLALNVELKRGAGEDSGIRKCLQRLQQVLQAD
ncbi:hypothetical protein KR044_000629 [Drosophila immigrans]|nr:hypothetical protein KR044_000629 [Drosophila immigrans]